MKDKKDYTIEDLKNMETSSKVTDDVMSKLEEAFNWDFTNEEASDHAGISPASYYNYCKMSSEFREKMERAKRFLFTIAKKNIRRAVHNEQNDMEGVVDNSWKLLQLRQKPIYASRNEVTGADGKDINTGVEALKNIATNLKKLVQNDDDTSTEVTDQAGNGQNPDSEPF